MEQSSMPAQPAAPPPFTQHHPRPSAAAPAAPPAVAPRFKGYKPNMAQVLADIRRRTPSKAPAPGLPGSDGGGQQSVDPSSDDVGRGSGGGGYGAGADQQAAGAARAHQRHQPAKQLRQQQHSLRGGGKATRSLAPVPAAPGSDVSYATSDTGKVSGSSRLHTAGARAGEGWVDRCVDSQRQSNSYLPATSCHFNAVGPLIIHAAGHMASTGYHCVCILPAARRPAPPGRSSGCRG